MHGVRFWGTRELELSSREPCQMFSVELEALWYALAISISPCFHSGIVTNIKCTFVSKDYYLWKNHIIHAEGRDNFWARYVSDEEANFQIEFWIRISAHRWNVGLRASHNQKYVLQKQAILVRIRCNLSYTGDGMLYIQRIEWSLRAYLGTVLSCWCSTVISCWGASYSHKCLLQCVRRAIFFCIGHEGSGLSDFLLQIWLAIQVLVVYDELKKIIDERLWEAIDLVSQHSIHADSCMLCVTALKLCGLQASN